MLICPFFFLFVSVSNAVAEPKLKWNIPWDKIKEQNVGINKQLGKLKAFTKTCL